jgi:hypothetical protein
MVALGLTLLLAAAPNKALSPAGQENKVWTLTLDNGDKLTVQTASGAGEWSRGGKVFDKAQFQISGGAASFELDRTISQDELRTRLQGLQAAMQTPKWQALHEREVAVNQKCSAEKKPSCDEDLKLIKTEQQELTRAAVGALKSCEQLHLKLAAGKLTGTAENCADGKSHPVTGTEK